MQGFKSNSGFKKPESYADWQEREHSRLMLRFMLKFAGLVFLALVALELPSIIHGLK